VGCGGQFFTSSGILQSPGYTEEDCHNGEDCFWTITTQEGTTIKLEVIHLDMEYHHDCVFDALLIRDGFSPISSQLGKICGIYDSNNKPIFRSSGNKVLIHYKTDDLRCSKGFTLKWESEGCPDPLPCPTESSLPCPPCPKCPKAVCPPSLNCTKPDLRLRPNTEPNTQFNTSQESEVTSKEENKYQTPANRVDHRVGNSQTIIPELESHVTRAHEIYLSTPIPHDDLQEESNIPTKKNDQANVHIIGHISYQSPTPNPITVHYTTLASSEPGTSHSTSLHSSSDIHKYP
ncbi:unnamed protein product, partial [Meganyctiphanes norvegica]